MEIFLGGAAGVLAVGLTVFVIIAARRGLRIQELDNRASELHRKLEAAEQRIGEKNRAVEEAHGKLSQVKSEMKQAKKKAYLLEQKDKGDQSEPEPEADRLQELALQEARSEARRSGEEAVQAAEECARLRGQVEKLKQELDQLKSRETSRKQEADGKKKTETDKLKNLESENRDLKKKLESSRRKAKNDSQVYKVTKSKLDLAMEKIGALEKALESRKTGG
jgi:chromosome segregation ATPase